MLLGTALAAGDARDDQPRLAVLADQRGSGGRRRGPRGGHLAHVRRRFQLVSDLGADRASGRCLCAPVRRDADQQFHVALTEFVDEQLGRLRRLRRRILESASRQVFGHRDAEDSAGHHHQEGHRDDPAGCGNGEQCDALQHVASFRLGYRR